jgi:pyridinium-3,5-bisthiocarboxylic acid mononucleotide nickel chelatase
MPIALFDPYSGASGDMTLGALVDAGLDVDALRARLDQLGLAGYRIEASTAQQHGIHGTRFRVIVTVADPPHRHWSDIRAMISDSELPDRIKARSLDIFAALAEAEAAVHGTPVDDVHFHEVGAIDSIVDIVGVAIAFDLMGIEQAYSGPLRLGSGFVDTHHGRLPVPAPATAALIAAASAPIRDLDVEAELLTPTGAAILTRLARFERPDIRPRAVGYGFGSRELPWPNALRVWIGEPASETELTTVPGDRDRPVEVVLETNIDDMNPEFYEPLTDLLFDTGALDVWLTPITMKRGRPATMVSAICDLERRAAVESILLEHSTTLGVRMTPVERTKAGRRIETVTTRWGEVRVKLKILDGRVSDVAPEYADCLAIVREHRVPIRLVYGEATRIAEAFSGRRTGENDEWRGWQL